MGKILVVSNGIYPDLQSVSYTVELATSLNSQVEILEVVPKDQGIAFLNRKKSLLGAVKSLMEDVYVAVGFAEENQHDIAKEIINEAVMNLHPYITKLKNYGIHARLVLKSGEFLKETKDFIRKNKDILMAILAIKKDKKSQFYLDRLKKEVDIPIIMVGT